MRKLTVVLLLILFLMTRPFPALAADVLGIHILSPDELDKAEILLKQANKDNWDYVTIPFTFEDSKDLARWQNFFDRAREKKIQPIIRLTSRFENEAWTIPTRKDITDQVKALSSLHWPQDGEKIVIVFNEPNHRKEWGGQLEPEGYARILQFTAEWLRSEHNNYVVLPAGLDLAAPNGPDTMEAFTYLEKMLAVEPALLDGLDGWTSHSYPNPGFSGSPTARGKMSIRGYETELAFLSKYTQKELPVYITETGWIETKLTSRWLPQYYQYAIDHVWSDPRIRAVTPFVLQGAPGSFAAFSFLDAQGNPTRHYDALQKALN